MARLVALVACIAAGASSTALGSSDSHVTWYAEHARLVSPTFGYAVVDWQRVQGDPSRGFGGGLYLYRDGRWTKSTDAGSDGGIEDVAFPDQQHGWIATFDCARALVRVYRTSDGGRNWRALPIKTSHSCGGGPSYLSFPNAREGWLEPVSPNGPGGAFFTTTDGGARWPGGGGLGEGGRGGSDSTCLARITATSARTAWQPCALLLHTTDGGKTWHHQVLRLPARWRRSTVTGIGDPQFFGRRGVVAVTAWSRQARAVLFYVSDDGGQTWSFRADRRAAGFCQRVAAWSSSPEATVAFASPTTWWVMTNRHGRVDVTRDGGRHWQSYPSATLRSLGWCHVRSLTAGSSSFAWATTNERYRSALYETRDGGRNWRQVIFPLR